MMKYIVTTSCYYEVEKIKERYPCLSRYGLQEEYTYVKRRQWIADENLNRIETDAIIEKEKYLTIKIASMEELHEFIQVVGHPVVIDSKTEIVEKFIDLPCIEIYYGYRE